ncbi:MAG TPA: hypothetical protein VJJ22_00410 [Candidatus Paceibacterota bacterium]
MDKEEAQFSKLLGPIRELRPSKTLLARLIGLDERKATTWHALLWYAMSPVVAVLIIFLIKASHPVELDTESDMMAMTTESEAISKQVDVDLRAIEEDNVSELGLEEIYK